MRPQRFPAGLGSRNIPPSSNAPSRDVQNGGLATNSNPSRPAIYRRVQEPSSSSTPTLPHRGPSGHSSHQENHVNQVQEVQEKASPDSSSGPSSADSESTNGAKLAYVGGSRKVNMVKTPLSTMQHRPDSHPTTSPQEIANARSFDNRAPPVSLIPPFPLVPPLLPLPPANSRLTAPVNPPLIDLHSFPIQFIPLLPPPPTSSIPYATILKGRPTILGMPHDDTKAGGIRGSFFKELEPPPNPSRSVVMEILPRKFRTQSFILEWLAQFPFQPSRFELVDGKVFFEFKSERDAHLAWHSPRMGGRDGLMSVRLFWYRVLPQPALEKPNTIQKANAQGTIEDPAQPQPQPQLQPQSQPISVSDSSTEDSGPEDRLELEADVSQSHTPIHKPDPPPPLAPPSTINVEEPAVTVNPPAQDIKSNPDNKTSHHPSSSKHPVWSPPRAPPATTRPLTQSIQPSDHSDHQMDTDSAMTGDLPPGGVSSFLPDVTISKTFAPTPLPTISSSSLASSTACTSTAVFPTFHPQMPHSSVDTTSVDPQVPPFAMDEELAEASHSAAEMSRLEAAKRTEWEKFDGLLPIQAVTDSMDAGALAKEQTLRELVLQSRKRKLVQAGSNQQPTSTTAPTATSGHPLEQLAVNFIADAISRPPAAKRVKVTPSPTAMIAWGKRLEQHIEWSKGIMAKIHSAPTRTEKNRLLEILREKDRCVFRWHMLDFACFND
jgi:hypothetical protein